MDYQKKGGDFNYGNYLCLEKTQCIYKYRKYIRNRIHISEMKRGSQITLEFDLGNKLDVISFFLRQGIRGRHCRIFGLRKWVSFWVTVLLGVYRNASVHCFHILEPGLLYQDTKSIGLYSLLIQEVKSWFLLY